MPHWSSANAAKSWLKVPRTTAQTSSLKRAVAAALEVALLVEDGDPNFEVTGDLSPLLLVFKSLHPGAFLNPAVEAEDGFWGIRNNLRQAHGP